MKIVVVGNSNCVFKVGFVPTLTEVFATGGHEVINLSVGGSCSLFHIYTLLTNRELLESADIVILDSMIIDIYHTQKGLMSADQIARSIHDMYALYAALEARVVAVYFPSIDFVGKHRDAHVYATHRAACDRYNLSVVDIYEEVAKYDGFEAYFTSGSHLIREYPQKIATNLANHLMAQESDLGKGAKSVVADTPYQAVTIDDAVLSGLGTTVMSSKHFDKTVGILDRPVSMGDYAGNRAMGMFQWSKEHCGKLSISGQDSDYIRLMRPQFALFDVFTSEPALTADSVIGPTDADTPVSEGPTAHKKIDQVGPPHVMGLLLKRINAELDVAPAPDIDGKGCEDMAFLMENQIFEQG